MSNVLTRETTIANLRARFENARSRSREVDTATFYLAADGLTALSGWEAALATSAEERVAWDRYVAVAMTTNIGSQTLAEFAHSCVDVADAMLAARATGVGGGA